MTNVRDNKTLSRFELDTNVGVAFANYRRTASAVIITHTETPRAMRGRGIASELVDGALQLIRAGRDQRWSLVAASWWITWRSIPSSPIWWATPSGNPDGHVGQPLQLAQQHIALHDGAHILRRPGINDVTSL